jgi:hypothetical protein
MRDLAMRGLAPAVAVVAFCMCAVTAVEAQSAAPNAPSDAHVLGGVLSWQDNSSDEDGFRITARLFGSASGSPDVDHSYDVPANTTSFVLPPEAFPHCDDLPSANWFVVATKDGAESAPAVASISVNCVAPLPALPGTGSESAVSPGARSPETLPWSALMLAGGALLAGAGARFRRRHARRQEPHHA